MNQNNIIVSPDNLFLEMKDKSIYDLIEEHLKKYKDKNKKHTYRAYKGDIYGLFKFIGISQPQQLATIPFSNLSVLCLKYLNKSKKEKESNKDIITNPRTLNRKAYAIKVFFDFLIYNYNYPKNPLKNFQPYTTEKQTTTKSINERDLLNLLHYTKEEYNNSIIFIKKLSKLQNYLIICFLALSLRRSEVANLEWENIDKTKKFIKVLEKGQKYKYLPIPKPVFDLLTILHKMKEDNYNSPFIFSPIKLGNYSIYKSINQNYIYGLVKRLCKKLGIEGNITPHSFRTTFVKKALEKGIPYLDIMNATGHKSIELIKYYDTTSKIDNNAANCMAELFN